jgi:xylulokinase
MPALLSSLRHTASAGARLLQPRCLSTGTEKLFLGLDSSTQGLKATALNEQMEVVFNTQINFDADLPHFGTEGGFHQGENDRVTAPTLMFVEALDMVLGQMRKADFKFSSVAAISGSGQQHGSVYLKDGEQWSALSLLL